MVLTVAVAQDCAADCTSESIVLGENVDRLQVLGVPAAIHIPLLNIPQSGGNKICSISFSSH